MITLTDAANIVYMHAKSLGYETYQVPNIPRGGISGERVTIKAKSLTPNTYWKKCFVDVNLIAPDVEDEGDTIRLNEMEREFTPVFESLTDTYDGTVYHIGIQNTDTFEDKSLKCHYVNLRLQFEILNVR